MWSHAMVFLASFSEMSLASDDTRVMNSTQHSISKSRASLEKESPLADGRISLTIFWTVAVRVISYVLEQKRGSDDEPFGRDKSSLPAEKVLAQPTKSGKQRE